MEFLERHSHCHSSTIDKYKYHERNRSEHWKANDRNSTCNMWTRSDIFALLQLLTVIILAMLHGVWRLVIYQGESPQLSSVPLD
jgi:hypothetical protein